MPIAPNLNEHLAAQIRLLYANAETEILALLSKRIAAGVDQPEWATRKYGELRANRREVEHIIARLRGQAPQQVAEIVRKTFNDGADEATRDFEVAGLTNATRVPFEGTYITQTLAGAFSATNTATVESLVAATTRTLDAAHLHVLRATDDAYRAVVAETEQLVVSGVKTRRQAAQEALTRFADQGITAFKDKAGRDWDLSTYTEMSLRAATNQAAVQGYITETSRRGHDLVRVSDHPEECEACRRWEGRVLSITGQTPGYPTVADAQGGGLWHPGCGHRLHVWKEGVSLPVTPEPDPDGYEDRQKQRYMERMVRHWKRRQLVAITPEDQKATKAMVQKWRSKLADFTEETGRRRRYDRESITKAR